MVSSPKTAEKIGFKTSIMLSSGNYFPLSNAIEIATIPDATISAMQMWNSGLLLTKNWRRGRRREEQRLQQEQGHESDPRGGSAVAHEM